MRHECAGPWFATEARPAPDGVGAGAATDEAVAVFDMVIE